MTEQEEAFEQWWDEVTQVRADGMIRVPSYGEAWKAAIDWARQGQEPDIWVCRGEVIETKERAEWLRKEGLLVVGYYTRPAPPKDVSELVEAGNLALEYFRHKQQRYKNRRPVWVIRMEEALAKWEGTPPQP